MHTSRILNRVLSLTGLTSISGTTDLQVLGDMTTLAGIIFRIGLGTSSSSPLSSLILEGPYAVCCETKSRVINLKKCSTWVSLCMLCVCPRWQHAVEGLQCFVSSVSDIFPFYFFFRHWHLDILPELFTRKYYQRRFLCQQSLRQYCIPRITMSSLYPRFIINNYSTSAHWIWVGYNHLISNNRFSACF